MKFDIEVWLAAFGALSFIVLFVYFLWIVATYMYYRYILKEWRKKKDGVEGEFGIKFLSANFKISDKYGKELAPWIL